MEPEPDTSSSEPVSPPATMHTHERPVANNSHNDNPVGLGEDDSTGGEREESGRGQEEDEVQQGRSAPSHTAYSLDLPELRKRGGPLRDQFNCNEETFNGFCGGFQVDF